MFNVAGDRFFFFCLLWQVVWHPPPTSDGTHRCSVGSVRPAVGRVRGLGVVGQRPGHPAMSRARGNRAVRVHGQEERRTGHTVRVHRPPAHIQNDGGAQGQTFACHILPEAPAQQPA